jgi:hypothetical protein
MNQKKLTRRQFLISSSAMLAILTTGCAAMPGKETGLVEYPKLAGEKIQSPEHYGLKGCMTGIYTGNFKSVREKIGAYEKMVGQKPSYYLLPHRGFSHVTTGITSSSLTQIEQCASLGVIPFITYFAGDAVRSFADLDGIANGDYDKEIRYAAKDLKAIGETYGGFFIRTMEHMNTSWYANWGSVKSPEKFKKAWLKIWNLFESEGANHYATWVFNPYVPDPFGIASWYYPGDKYVDWIGMSGYNMEGLDVHLSASRVNTLFKNPYKRIYRKYANKPIMICEIATHQLPYKPKWIDTAFNLVKTRYFGVKGLSWHSKQWKKNSMVYMDMRIDSSPESIQSYKKCVSDPYFLGEIPYRKSV